MPLPPALAARLAKRGILRPTHDTDKKTSSGGDGEEEEVIAENYDGSGAAAGPPVSMSLAEAQSVLKGHPGCPNKYNVFHQCGPGCVRLWGQGHITPSPKYLRHQARLLARYPLPPLWKQVWDPGTGRHYYWDVSSDLVSWLPPDHPEARISESAATLREESHLAGSDAEEQGSSDDEQSDDGGSPDEDIDERLPVKHHQRINRPQRRSGVAPLNNDLDPMDPASYSDVGRGRWSDGLHRNDEAKTGADVTAAGPLFQMRPYPSPGSILRANAADRTPDN